MRFDSKVVIITGAGGGIGKAAAQIFAREGAKVVIAEWNEAIGKQTEEEIRQAGGDATFIQIDVSKEEDDIRLIDETIRLYGKIDVLFNNAAAGYSSGIKMGSILDIDRENWDALMAINLTGYYLVTKYALPHMIKQNSGNIVNTGSMNGLIGNPNTCDSYTASKGAIVALTRSWAADYAKNNIRVNCICPGPIETPMLAPALVNPDRVQHYNSHVLLGRVGKAEEVANLAVFLASDEASFITGAIVPVDGGWTTV